MKSIASGLKVNKSLIELNLSKFKLCPYSHYLSIGDNQIKDTGAYILSEVLKTNNTLVKLNLGNIIN